MIANLVKPDPKLDLVLERELDVPVDLVWDAWTDPEGIKHWFCPRPWTVTECEIDLRPGGAFNTVMESPEGKKFPNTGCLLEVVENKRLVMTDALGAGYRPLVTIADVNGSSRRPFFFTTVIEIEPHGKGTKYTATAMHSDDDGVRKHVDMGFHHGWSAALDQLVELAKAL